MELADRGTKRRCAHCGAPFYDLNHAPIVCPKCDTTFEPMALVPRGPTRAPRASRVPEPEIVDAADAEAFEEDEVLSTDTEDEEETVDRDEDEADEEEDRDDLRG